MVPMPLLLLQFKMVIISLNSNVRRQRINPGKNRKSRETIIRKWPSSAKEKAEMDGYLSAESKTGDVNPAITCPPAPPATTASLREIEQETRAVFANTHTHTQTISALYIRCIGQSIGYREFILSAILFGRKWTVCEAKGL